MLILNKHESFIKSPSIACALNICEIRCLNNKYISLHSIYYNRNKMTLSRQQTYQPTNNICNRSNKYLLRQQTARCYDRNCLQVEKLQTMCVVLARGFSPCIIQDSCLKTPFFDSLSIKFRFILRRFNMLFTALILLQGSYTITIALFTGLLRFFRCMRNL